MNVELTALVVLAVVVCVQQVFFMRQILKLVDRVMARNYGEYVQGELLQKEDPKPSSQDLGPPDTDIGIMNDYGLI